MVYIITVINAIFRVVLEMIFRDISSEASKFCSHLCCEVLYDCSVPLNLTLSEK